MRATFGAEIETCGKIDRKKNLSKFKDKENRSVNDTINWTGFRDQYFCAIVRPDFESKQYYMKKVDDLHANIGFSTGDMRIESKSKKVLGVDIYYGPQDKNVLKEFDSGFENIINYSVGGFFDWMAFKQTDAIARVMMVLLDFIHKIVRKYKKKRVTSRSPQPEDTV